MWDSGHTRKAHKSRPSASESCRNGDVPALTLSAINVRIWPRPQADCEWAREHAFTRLRRFLAAGFPSRFTEERRRLYFLGYRGGRRARPRARASGPPPSPFQLLVAFPGV